MHSWHKLKSLFIVAKLNFDNYILINILITVECHRVSNIMSWGNWVLVVTTRGQYGYLRKAIVLLFPVRRFQGPCSLYVVTIGGVNSSPGHLIHQKETCNPTMQQWRAETLPGFGSQSRRALAGACRVFSRKSTTTFQFAGALVGRWRLIWWVF